MDHRHISTDDMTLDRIEDLIERGAMDDWAMLCAACQRDDLIRDKVRRVAERGMLVSEWPQAHAVFAAFVTHAPPGGGFSR